MFKSVSKVQRSVIAIATASMLLITGSAIAGPKEKPQGKPGMKNIVEVASAVNAELGVFDTVLAAAQCDYFDGAVVDILTGKSKVTLFAPVDSAFAELGVDETNVCAAFNGMEGSVGVPDDLLGILAYHVTDGRRFSNSVFNRNGNAKEIEMILGSGYVTTEGGMLYGAGNDLDSNEENDNPIKIVGDFFDINASNGVIHVIDTVLIP
jgi:uncharacterized surface protein with fasciclin (FAS1) repeats